MMNVFIGDTLGEKVVSILLAAICILLLTMIPFAIMETRKEIKACEARGGEWVVVGHHWQNMIISNGKTVTIIPQYMADYGCTK